MIRSLLIIILLFTSLATSQSTDDQSHDDPKDKTNPSIKEDTTTRQENKESPPVSVDRASPHNRESRDLKPDSLNNMLNQLITVQEKNKVVQMKEKPTKGTEANSLINLGKKSGNVKYQNPITIRPATGKQNVDPSSDPDKSDSRESYLPLYACDDVNTEPTLLEPLYRGCMHGCQMREPVKVTLLKLQSPQPYKSKLEVIWLSATKMYDLCHEDIFGGEHRIKSATEYPLSDEEISKILTDVKDHLILNQDIIHGDYPKATCSYFQDTTASSVLTRIRKSHYELYYGPELDAYYFHLPTEQINILAWDTQYNGPSGSYRWNNINLDRPCLLKTGDEITCIGSMKDGDNLQCATAGLLLEGPYISSWNPGCNMMTTKDTRGTHFYRTKETMMSYREALQDKNPNIQSLSTAVTHIEELLCMSGCSELTLMGVANNTDLVVDTPVGIWKRKTGSGSLAIQCSAMSTGKIELLTPVCTLLGVVGIKHVSSSGMTYHWDMNQLYASSSPHPCLTEQLTDLEPIMRHQENGTFIIDTFIGQVELNTKTGESRLLSYNEDLIINKQRWFPNVLLEQKGSDDMTGDLEVAIMQQLRNLSAEYQSSCEEAKGPITLETVGGAVWMLEKDIHNYWEGLFSYFWIVKIIICVILIWLILYIIILTLGVCKTIMTAKSMVKVPVNYHRSRKTSDG